MNIAIIGAGYAGLSLAYFLEGKARVDVYDIGGGASSVSTGLLHPSPGKKAVPCWRSHEGMRASKELLELASKEIPVFKKTGILRIAINEEQERLFGGKTLWIEEGITVYSRLYLQELRKLCKKATFHTQKIHSLDEMSAFDKVIIAAGAETSRFVDLPMKRTIGQTLLCRWKEPLEYSLLASGHITPTEDPTICQVGSTYEHTETPDPKKALELLDKVALFYPKAKEFEIVEVRSGIRVAPLEGYRPIIEQINPKTWVFTGLGSRGLLYHSLFAQELARSLAV